MWLVQTALLWTGGVGHRRPDSVSFGTNPESTKP